MIKDVRASAWKRLCMLSAMLILCIGVSHAQRAVSGRVANEAGEGLAGATIQVKGAQAGTFTDADGRFSVSVPDDAAVLIVSFLGYARQEVTVGASSSLTITLVALRMVPTALLTRSLKMKALTVRSVGAALMASFVAIPLALAGFGVWALVGQHLFYAATSTALVWAAAEWRPRFEFRWAAARALLPFSLANFGARAGNFFSSQMDAIVIGLFWGPTAVGLYRLAARCIDMSLEFRSGALQFTSFPEFS